MPGRYTNNMAVLAKVETTSGTDATPSAATDGLLLTEVTIEPLNIDYADRNLLLPYFGGSAQLVASVSHKVSFGVELSASGTAGTSAVWGTLLLGCGMASASLTAPVRVEHTPVSSALKTLTLYAYDDGVLHKLVGAMGSVKLSAKKGETPKLMFEFLAAYKPILTAAFPAVTLTGINAPVPISKANVTDICIGCSYSAGALAGGTITGSNGFELDFGIDLKFFTTNSSERAEITGRKATISYEMEFTAQQEQDTAALLIAGGTTGLGFVINPTGVAGNKLLIHLPAIQRKSMKKVDSNGIRMIGFEANVLPVAGNDEIRIVQL